MVKTKHTGAVDDGKKIKKKTTPEMVEQIIQKNIEIQKELRA
jgi:hypothetical protein